MALVPFPGPQSGASRAPNRLPEQDDEALGTKMSFLEHLEELRTRLIHSIIAIVVGVLVSFTFIEKVFNFVFAPIRRELPAGSKLMYTEPGEAFSLYLQIAFIAGIVLAAPYVMYQVWLFIAPGLYTKEKRFAIPFVLFSTIGFVAGAFFNHYIVFPFMMAFFGSFNAPDLAFMPKLEPVFSLYTKMLIGMGIVFQMPTLVFFLAKMGVVTARFLWRNFRYAILVIFIIAAVVTPTGDMLTQTIFAAPMIGLYLLSILIAWLVGPDRKPG